jgi:Ca2+-binding RTX toxin-like protein
MRCVLALALVLSVTGVASADVSHAGWPKRDGVLWIARDVDSRNTGTERNDELLGGDGSDRIHGGSGHDVIWGDKNPSGQPAGQHDIVWGGGGADWIYTSHGTNEIHGGGGADNIWGYYGHGVIDCGPGRDTAHVRLNHAYRVRRCERIKHF